MNHLTTDLALLQRKIALHRDTKAYEQLYKTFYKPLLYFAESILRSREAAEEVYSDVLLKIWNLGEALADVTDLRCYLYKSIRNASLNYLARYNKVRVVELEKVAVDTAGSHDVFHQVAHAELQKKLTVAVMALPEKCQAVYRLIKEHGFTYRQVAEVMNISSNTVEGHMTTALKKISTSLRPYLRS